MSQQNVDIVRGLYEAFGQGNIEGVMGVLHPEIRWMEAENFIYADGNPYIGPSAVLEGVFLRIANDWDQFQVSPGEIFDSGDSIIARGYYTGTCKRNGKPVRAQFAHFFTVNNGKVTSFQQYTDTAQFLRVIEQ